LLPQDKTSFSNGVMNIRMDGNSGARLYYPLAMEYGLIEVTAKVSGVSGVVSAFYVSGAAPASALLLPLWPNLHAVFVLQLQPLAGGM
jgi:hypothetical protein